MTKFLHSRIPAELSNRFNRKEGAKIRPLFCLPFFFFGAPSFFFFSLEGDFFESPLFALLFFSTILASKPCFWAIFPVFLFTPSFALFFFSFESALFFLFSYGGLFFLRPLFALLFFFSPSFLLNLCIKWQIKKVLKVSEGGGWVFWQQMFL